MMKILNKINNIKIKNLLHFYFYKRLDFNRHTSPTNTSPYPRFPRHSATLPGLNTKS